MPKKIRMKPMLPTLRERKRYVAFEVISPKKVNNFKLVADRIKEASLNFLGVSGMSKAGVMVLDKWSPVSQRGLIKVNYKYVNELKASLALIKELDQQEVIFRSVGTSGILKKAEEKYLAG